MDANRQLISRGVNITRYFIFLNTEEFEASRDLIRLNIDAGVDTWIVCLSETAGLTHAKDLIIVDNKSGGELELSSNRDPLSALMSEREDDLAEYRRKLRNLHAVAVSAHVRMALD